MSTTNGHQTNGHSPNGNGNQPKESSTPSGVITATAKDSQVQSPSIFSSFTSPEQGVVFRQSPVWSRGVIWTIMGVTTAAIVWAAVAPIEQVIPAQGKLEPQGEVKEIQAPVNGVVEKVLVKEGEKVKEGDKLVIFDTTASKSQLASLQEVRRALQQENKFYQTLMNDSLNPTEVEREIIKLEIPKDVATLARNRTAIVAENQLYRVQLGESSNNINFQPEQLYRLEAARRELESRSEAARLETQQLEKQLTQTQVQLADAKNQLVKDNLVLAEIKSRNEKSMTQIEASLKIEQDILNDITPLQDEGALARYQIKKQEQSVKDRMKTLVETKANGEVDYQKQRQQVEERIAKIGQLQEEEKRLNFAIDQAQEKFNNTKAITEKDVRDKMSDNQKRLAEIDSQLTKIIVDNKNKLAENSSQISQAEQTLKYQVLKSPVGGTVFDLKAYTGFVPEPSRAQALMKIVPDDYLIAKVDITNKDIGFVRPGMITDIRIDSFPFSEYGDIKGKVDSVSSDSLPPDEIHKYYRFPAKVKLNEQYLKVGDKEVPLQSGMAVSVNIKIRENRTVLSLFLEQFTKSTEALKGVR